MIKVKQNRYEFYYEKFSLNSLQGNISKRPGRAAESDSKEVSHLKPVSTCAKTCVGRKYSEVGYWPASVDKLL